MHTHQYIQTHTAKELHVRKKRDGAYHRVVRLTPLPPLPSHPSTPFPHTTHSKLAKELHEKKKEMALIIEQSNIAYEARDQVQVLKSQRSQSFHIVN